MIAFTKFHRLVENHFNNFFLCDYVGRGGRGGGGGGVHFLNICESTSTMWHFSTTFLSAYSKTKLFIEKKHQHIIKTKLIMTLKANLLARLWVDVFLTMVYLINKLPST